MSHFNVCVLVPILTPDRNETLQDTYAKYDRHINERLEKFDINREVPPYKQYIKLEEVLSMSEHYAIPISEVAKLAEKLPDWQGSLEGDVDEQGIFEITKRNPDAHVDYWSILGYIPTENYEKYILGYETGSVVAALVTAAGDWIQGPLLYTFSFGGETEKQLKDWDMLIRKILVEHDEQHVAFLVDCHM